MIQSPLFRRERAGVGANGGWESPEGPISPNTTLKSAIGDLLRVTVSLAQRKELADKEQILNMDPPYYGIKFASHFQHRSVRRDVKDKRARSNRHGRSLLGNSPFLSVIPESKPPVTMIMVNY
jgi:hypothetical protein